MMSKVSFRARALDVTKPMPVYRASDIPDLPDFATINRSVPQMPTGMEKEEESEHHLQRALSAQQVYGSSETLVIPIPEIVTDTDHYERLYEGDFKQPKQYVHMQAFGMDQEIPDYDMDSDDERWIKDQGRKMEITATKFEEMMDRLEKGSGQQVVTLHEAKALLKEDDDLIMAVYDYWLNKRLSTKHTLILQVKSEKRDGSTTNNPYVAFRRRSEKMQTRKNRKNDEVSYEKMLKLRCDINRALTVIEMMKRREKAKKEMLQLTIEILEKRNGMGDYSGEHLAAAEKERLSKPRVPVVPLTAHWARPSEVVPGKKKREYKRRRVKTAEVQKPILVTPTPQYSAIDVIHPDIYTSDDDTLSPAISTSDHDDENDPDGPFAFRRRKSCHYHAPLFDRLGRYTWDAPQEGGKGDARHRYSLLSLPPPYRCVGFGRRRVGRGGRIMVDRAETAWDDALCSLDILDDGSAKTSLSDYIVYIRDRNIKHFRPHTPPVQATSHHAHPVFRSSVTSSSSSTSSSSLSQFYRESFQSQREELIRIRQSHQQLLLRQENCWSNKSPPDAAMDLVSARYAASAVIDTVQLDKSLELAKRSLAAKVVVSPFVTVAATTSSGVNASGVTLSGVNASAVKVASVNAAVPLVPTVTLVNGPSLTERATVHPSSPAALLHLNFPLHASTAASTTAPAGSDLRFQKPTKTILTHTSSLLKLTPANGTNTSIIKSNHDDPIPLRTLTNDTPIPMDVT